jgi:hypothetical protein
MLSAAVTLPGLRGREPLPRVPLGVTYVITGCVLGMKNGVGIMYW